MSFVLKWVTDTFSKTYKNILSKRLKNYGLKYEDLLIEHPDVLKAVERTNPAIRVERERRIKRAFDVSAKKKTIPEEFHNYNPYDLYLTKKIRVAHFERTERHLLDH